MVGTNLHKSGDGQARVHHISFKREFEYGSATSSDVITYPAPKLRSTKNTTAKTFLLTNNQCDPDNAVWR